MKKALLVFMFLFLFSSLMASASSINLTLNDESVVFNNSTGYPFIDINNRTQVPFRIILEKFGAEVNWIPETRTAIATKDGIEVRVPVGEKSIYRNGVKITNDTAAIIKNGRIYLPIRGVMEAFGMVVAWDSGTNSIAINQEIEKQKQKVSIYSTEW